MKIKSILKTKNGQLLPMVHRPPQRDPQSIGYQNMTTTSNSIQSQKPLSFRDNPAVQKRLNDYKAANEVDVAYYSRVVKEAPQRAVDMLLYKDMLRHEADMQVIEKQMSVAQQFYQSQPAEVQARIDGRLENAPAYYRTKAFVNEVLREMDRAKRHLRPQPPAAGNTNL